MYAQKINWGTLNRIPEICVDRFGAMSEVDEINWDKSRAFFLTHCDPVTMSDVLNGYLLLFLEDPTMHPSKNQCRMYMHEVSYKILEYFTTTQYVVDGKHKLNLLRRLVFNGRIIFTKSHSKIRLRFKDKNGQLPDRLIEVTPLPAGSSPGSLMYMFEEMNKAGYCIYRILYTGNCRLSLADLKLMPEWRNASGHMKVFDMVYLDTSHFNHNTKELPSRRLTIDTALEMINEHEKADISYRFDVNTPYVVFDLVFIKEHFRRFGRMFHTGTNLADLCKNPVIGMENVFTKGESSFHFNCSPMDDCFPCDSKVHKIELHCHVGMDEKKIKSLQSVDTYKWNNCYQAAYARRHEDIAGIYSTNLSRNEAVRMLRFLNVDNFRVKPLYIPLGMSIGELEYLISKSLVQRPPPEPEDIFYDFPATYFDFTIGPHNIKPPNSLLLC